MIAWHYTTAFALKQIVSSGLLLPSPIPVGVGRRQLAGVAMPGLRAVLWFSRHQYFEPTARKSVRGELLSIGKMHAAARGLARLGVLEPATFLTPWPQIGAAAGLSRPQRRQLERSAPANTDPRQWLGTLEPVPYAWCVVQLMTEDLRWIDAEIAELRPMLAK